MATEITSAGYQDLRDYIEANWNFIAIEDTGGTELLRISTSDARVTWTHSAGSQTLKLELVLSGDDSEITLPQAFDTAKVYKTSSASNHYCVNTFSDVNFETTADQTTITFEINVPTLA